MSLLTIASLVAATGAVGGALNCLLTGDWALLPKKNEAGAIQPGILGNLFLGAAAAVLSWGLYGPFADLVVTWFGGKEPPAEPTEPAIITLGAIMGFLLVGAAGGRWISAEIEKRVWKAAAMHAARAQRDLGLASDMVAQSAAKAFVAAKHKADTAEEMAQRPR